MIGAGRNQDGQPTEPGQAGPDLDRSGDPRASGKTGGTEAADPAGGRAPSAGEAGARDPATARGTVTSSATLAKDDEQEAGAAEPADTVRAAGETEAAEGGQRNALFMALRHTWV